ncbi:hypothetical protein DFH09DRAFT_1098806 [Mycena vulgaris]|nr:hypothetical protein DFH09DRAFT_1098806 [Mycena vulgaris]
MKKRVWPCLAVLCLRINSAASSLFLHHKTDWVAVPPAVRANTPAFLVDRAIGHQIDGIDSPLHGKPTADRPTYPELAIEEPGLDRATNELVSTVRPFSAAWASSRPECPAPALELACVMALEPHRRLGLETHPDLCAGS